MAYKFMINAAFKTRLLLQPSHQRTVLFATVNRLKCPIPSGPMLPLTLSFRSYSESTPTSPLLKPSGSTEGLKSSRPKDKNTLFRKGWGKIGARAVKIGVGAVKTGAVAGAVAGLVALGCGLIILGTCFAKFIMEEWYPAYLRRKHQAARDSAIYEKLKKGPVF